MNKFKNNISYKPLKNLQQKYKQFKEIIGSVYFLIDQSMHILWYEYFSNIFSTKKKKNLLSIYSWIMQSLVCVWYWLWPDLI